MQRASSWDFFRLHCKQRRSVRFQGSRVGVKGGSVSARYASYQDSS